MAPLSALPTVTCILTSYNRPRLLADAIESVRRQTLQAWQLIIADDGSAAPTLEVVHSAVASDVRVQAVRHDGPISLADRKARLRYCVGINRAIPFIKAPYVCFLCDDDFYSPWAFECLTKALRRSHNGTGAGDRPRVVYGGLRALTFDKTKKWDSEGEPVPGLTFCDFDETDPASRELVDTGAWREGLLSKMSGVLDHGQPMMDTRLLTELGGPPWWPETPPTAVGDALFFARLDRMGVKALAVRRVTVNKRYHRRSYGALGLADPQRE